MLRRIRRVFVFALFACTALGGAAHANNFTVSHAGSDGPDVNPGNGACASANGNCTLEAAIGEANALTGPHTITFSVTAVTLTAQLPNVTAPVTINGANAGAIGGRVDLNGNALSGLQLFDAPTVPNANGARGSTITNLVIRNFNGNGISLSGHGYTVTNCYIGLTPDGATASPNSANGIDMTGTIAAPSTIPALPGNFDFTPAQIAAQLIVLFGSIPANTFTLNVVSGNNDAGISLRGDKAALNIVSANFIGTSPDGMTAIPNGNAGGGGNHPGVRLTTSAYANLIGPGNVISGNNTVGTDNGVDAVSGAVVFPNFIAGNSIGLGADATGDIGNGGSGIKTDTFPEVDGNNPDNPTNYSLFIVGNLVSDNKGTNASGPDGANGPNAGISITGASARVKVTGNLIGLGSFGGVLSLAPDHGNAGDGIFVSTSDHEIGGSLAADFNVIAANGRHGIMIAGAGTSKVVVRNNFIGVPDPTMLDVLNLGNAVEGIHIDRASANTIGGTGALDDNVIAANGRHGVQLRNGSSTNGWANLFQRNQIYANTALGIDLDRTVGAPDPIPDPLADPNTNYSNFGQNQPWICSSQPTDPAPCIGASAPTFDGTSTTVRWLLATSANATIRVEFFARQTDGQTFLDELVLTTDAAGLVTGPGCAAGVCTSTVGSGIDTTGTIIEMTATDVSVRDVPPIGVGIPEPSNNTSEFSNPVGIAQPGELEFSAPVYTVGEAGVTATITVNRTNGADGAVTIDFTTADGTAQQPADYATASSPPPLMWADQDSAPKTFTISVTGDTAYEPGGNETVQLSLSNPLGGATLGPQSAATLEIVDDDLEPTISIDDVSQLEGDVGTTPFVFNVTLSNASSQTITVVANTTPGSAAQGTDYSAVTNQTITFNPGEIAKTVSVDVMGDSTSEVPNETFTVDLSAPANATIADGQGLATIVDDDAGAVFTIDSVSVTEGNSGTAALTFTVTRSQTSGIATVNFATADSSATIADGDYVAASGTLTFPDTVATQPVTVLVNGDTKFESTETLVVNLSSPSAGTTIGQGVGTGTINNDDAQPAITISDVSLPEGNAGNAPFAFAVTLSNASDQTVTVAANTADGSATFADSDYAVVTNQTITFTPGQTAQTVTVGVIGDTTSESNETFTVGLSAPNGATLADAQGQGTIVDDDSGSVFTIANVTVNEGNAGTTALTFTVTRSQTTGAASVDFATTDGSATVAGNDYTAASGTLTFADTVATQTITVNVNGDTTFEGNETLTVTLSSPSAGTSIGQGTATGTITNDDTQPAIAIDDVSQNEGNAGTTTFTFTLTLSNPSSQIVTVVADTADGGASAPGDYAAIVAQTITFNPGQMTQTLTVDVSGDPTSEPPAETFTVDLSAATNATIADAQGLGTIVDDDTGAVFTIGNATANEGNTGTTAFTFTVTRSQTTGIASIDFATADGTATVAGQDYVATNGTLSFADGIASRTLAVSVNGDTTFEVSEAFVVNLSNPSAGTLIGQGSGTGTITNDDTQPAITIDDVSLAEGDSGSTMFDFSVTLSSVSSQTVTVVANTIAMSATPGADFTPIANQTITFAPGVTAQTVSVEVLGETAAESDETFMLGLSLPANATIADPQGTGTIVDDDTAGGASVFSIANVSANEGANGVTTFTFTVSRTNANAPASVDFATADGSALAGSDYTAVAGTLSFATGVATRTFAIDVLGDGAIEGNETFFVNLSNPVGGSIGAGGTSTATILDDDAGAGVPANAVPAPSLDLRGLLALIVLAGCIGALAMRNRASR